MSFPMKTGKGGSRYPVLRASSTEPLPIMQVYNLLYHNQIYCKIDPQNRNILRGKINSKPFKIEIDEIYDSPTPETMVRTDFFKISTVNYVKFLKVENPLDVQAIKEIFLDLFPTLELVEWLTELLNERFPQRFQAINGMIFGIYNGQRVQIYEYEDHMGLGLECFKILNLNTSQKTIAFHIEDTRDTKQMLFNKLMAALDKIMTSGFRTRVVNLDWPPWLDESRQPPPDFFRDQELNWAQYPESL